MNRYYSYHPQAHAQMAPYFSNTENLYARPEPHPSSYRRRLRDIFGQLVGFMIVGLAFSTLFLNSPDKYMHDVEIPAEMLTPKPLSELWQEGRKTMPNMEMEQEFPVGQSPEQKPLPLELQIAHPQEAPKSFVKGTYVVQITATKNLADAKNYYYDARNQNSDLFEFVRPGVQRANLGFRGVFYRLYVFPFQGMINAKDFCFRLKERGWDCFVKKR